MKNHTLLIIVTVLSIVSIISGVKSIIHCFIHDSSCKIETIILLFSVVILVLALYFLIFGPKSKRDALMKRLKSEQKIYRIFILIMLWIIAPLTTLSLILAIFQLIAVPIEIDYSPNFTEFDAYNTNLKAKTKKFETNNKNYNLTAMVTVFSDRIRCKITIVTKKQIKYPIAVTVTLGYKLNETETSIGVFLDNITQFIKNQTGVILYKPLPADFDGLKANNISISIESIKKNIRLVPSQYNKVHTLSVTK